MTRRGPKTKYNPDIHLIQLKWMARAGLTDKEMSKELGIARSTLNLWKEEHPEISDILKENKNYADSHVVDSLYKRAIGYEFEEKYIDVDEAGNKKARIIKRTIHPDTTACIFWLKNRQRKEWRDKQDVEHSGGMDFNIKEAKKEVKKFLNEESKHRFE